MRRSLTVILLLAIATAAGWTLYRWQRPDPAASDPWRAIPGQAALIVELPEAFSTWDRATHTTQLWATFEQLPGVAATGRLLAAAQARMEGDAALRDALSGTPALVALLRAGGPGIGSLFVFAPRNGGPSPEGALGELLGMDAATQRSLATGDIVQARPDTLLPSLSICLRQGLWLVASDPNVMDEALLQLEAAIPISDEPLVAQALRTLGGGSDAHVLLHTGRTARLLGSTWTPVAIEGWDLPPGWAAMDLRVRTDALLMSGLLVPEGDHPLLPAMQQQGNGRSALPRVLPATVAMLTMQHVADAAQWQRDRHATTLDPDLSASLTGWVEGMMGTATAPGRQGMAPTRWAFFTAGDPDEAAAALNGLCVEGCDTLAHRGIRLSQLPLNSTHERLLGPAFDFLERPWWALLGDVVLFSNGPDALRSAIDAWEDGTTLAGNARASGWWERMSGTAGRTLWCDVARARPLLATDMTADAAASFDALDSLWSSLGSFTLQLSPGARGHHHLVVGLQHAPLDVQDPRNLWSTPVGAAVARRPDIVLNHVNNTREVLVQDVDHRLHLLSSAGKILWSRQIDGPIIGAVHQVDRFRNGKLQLLFNTPAKLHLIDRNGRDVGGFPVDLPEAATAPLAVFDYDGERDYRVLLPLADGRVHNYALDGAPVKGWEAPRPGGPITNAVEHLRIRNKDYLLVIAGNGTLKVLDRRGSERESTPLALGEGAVLRGVRPGLDIRTTQLDWADPGGALHRGTLSGEQSLLSATGPAWSVDLDSDGVDELVRIAQDSLVVGNEGTILFTRTFGTPLLAELQPCDLGRGRVALAAVRPQAGQTGLVTLDGSEVEGLPVPGVVACQMVDLDLDDRLELVAVEADGTVTAHRLPALSRSNKANP